jgi:putative nucleotidyltransferase with HDIG domain
MAKSARWADGSRTIAADGGISASHLRLAEVLRSNRDEIGAAWLASVSPADRSGSPDLDRHLNALIGALVRVFDRGDWGDVQLVIDGLVLRRASRGLDLEHDLQRALLAGRHAVKPFLKEDSVECDEDLLDALHECIFRFSESYQGLQLASESDRLHSRIINSLVMTLEARDPFVKGHSISVALLSQRTADVLGYVDQDQAYLAGLLHDIGKVGVPDHVLLKASAPTAQEWEILKTHPVIGARILRPIHLYPEVIGAVLHHHENHDGSGYPYGLSGLGIPRLARIVRVADSFHAITSSRVFRQSRSTTEAIEEIADNRGRLYDPATVDAFMKVVESPNAVDELNLASMQIELGDAAIETPDWGYLSRL